MLFFLATSDYNYTQSNTTKIRVHLSSGVAEIYDQHQDLMGKIDNDIVEIETNFDNKIEKAKFLVQQAVFVVSTKNSISANPTSTDTAVYVYAKNVKEINSKLSIDDISKDYEIKKERLEEEAESIREVGDDPDSYDLVLNTKYSLLKEEVAFLKKLILVAKETKG